MKKRKISLERGRNITLFAGIWTFVAIELWGFGFYWDEVDLYVSAISAGIGVAIATAVGLALISE